MVDHRSDIYFLGIVLYDMVTVLIHFDADYPMTIIFKHIYEPLPSPRHYNPTLPVGVEQVIVKALAKDPADRYSSAGEMAQALRRQVHSDSVIMPPAVIESVTIFICYKRNAKPDEAVANYLYDYLTAQGHEVFIDRTMRTGSDWLAEFRRRL